MDGKKCKLSSSLEDYIEAIAEISDEAGHAHTKDIAQRLQIKMPSVTVALRSLSEAGLIIYNSHRPVELTAKGKIAAKTIIHRHQVLHAFFHEVLWLEQNKADKTACAIEHVVDDDTLARIALLNLMLQEHRSDTKGFRSALSEGLALMSNHPDCDIHPLSSMPIDITATIISSENLPNGLTAGDAIIVHAHSLDGRFIRISVNGKEITLPMTSAEKIWVARG